MSRSQCRDSDRDILAGASGATDVSYIGGQPVCPRRHMKVVLKNDALVAAVNLPKGANSYDFHRIDVSRFDSTPVQRQLDFVRCAIAVTLSGKSQRLIRQRQTYQN